MCKLQDIFEKLGICLKQEPSDRKLSKNIIKECADKLGCEEACIYSVMEVETGNRAGLLSFKDLNLDNSDDLNNYPVILFEGHIFYRELKKKGLNPESLISEETKDIIYPSWTREFYSKSQIEEYQRYNRACNINEECAMLATSYGFPQIMGFNYKACGYDNVKDFVKDMSYSENNQLKAFVSFIENSGLKQSLINKDWETFARKYNGPGFKENHYDEKLAKAYQKYKS